MNVTTIPFVQTVGIEQNPEGRLTLPFKQTVHNHLQTMHASAQFTLAETASGELLQIMFPELVGKVVPLLRSSEIKFKKPTTKDVCAYASISEDDRLAFHEQFNKKNRAVISVDVSLKDSDDVTTCTATFSWYVQGI